MGTQKVTTTITDQVIMTSVSSNNKYKIDHRQSSGYKDKTVLSDKSLPSIPCPCHRPLRLIMGKVCGVCFTGRKRLLCCSHPSTRYIQDVDVCKECGQGNKEYLMEFDIFPGMEETHHVI